MLVKKLMDGSGGHDTWTTPQQMTPAPVIGVPLAKHFFARGIAILTLLWTMLFTSPFALADWEKNFGTVGNSTVGIGSVLDSAGNVYLVGYFKGATLVLDGVTLTRIGTRDAFVAKLDSSGTTVWAKNFGGSGAEVYSQDITLDASGNVIISGYFFGADLTTPALTKLGNNDAFVIKLDTSGNTTWSKNYGGSGASAFGYSVAADSSDNVYLGGRLHTGDLTTPALTRIGTEDAFAIKLDSSGNTTWSKNYGGTGATTVGRAIQVGGDGSVYLGGYFSGADLTTPALSKIGTQDAFAFKLNSSGTTTWSKNYGGSGASAFCRSIAVDSSGNVYLSGYFSGADLTTPAVSKIGTQDAFVFKVNSSGVEVWSKNYGGSGATASALRIRLDSSGNVYVAGTFSAGNMTTPALTLIGTSDVLAMTLNSSGTVSSSNNYGGSGASPVGWGNMASNNGGFVVTGYMTGGSLTTPALAAIGTFDTYVIARGNLSSPSTYTVTYNGNTNTAGSVPTDAGTYANGATVTVLGNTGTLTKTGYTFAGWNTAANGSGTDYAASGSATFAMGSANVTLYAKWTAVTYTVTYNGNTNTGGSAPTDAGTYANGATVTVLGNTGTLTKTGYTFAGWNTAANGSGTDYAASGSATFAMGSANVTLYAKWTALDSTAPTLPVANIVVNNQADPHKMVLTFSENLDNANIGAANAWTVTANGGTPAYSIASVALASGNQITLTLNAVDLSGTTTYIPNSAANGHLKVTPPATLTDVAGNTYAAGLVTEAGATHVLDSTAPTLSAVSTSAPTSSGGTLAATASEKAKGYWIAVASGATAPTPAQVKAAVTYGGVAIVASGSGVLPNGSAGSLTLTGLAAGTGYDIHLMAEDAAGNASAAISSATLTTAAAPAPSSGGGTTSTTTTLPTGGGTATLTGGQSVTVTENGKDGTTINLPPPSTGTSGSGSNAVNVTLPGTGTVGVSSSSSGTQLGVTHVTLPGTTTAVSTVTVDQGSASFTASKSGQAVAGLKNGIVVVSGSKDSQVSVDATGPSATIGVKSSDTIIVPTGSTGVSGTKVDLPSPSASGGQASTVSLIIGGHELSITSSQSNTTMTFQVVNIGGVQTPVMAVTGSAQVSSSGEDKPLVSVAGNVIRSGKSGGSHQVCNTVVQASSDASSDVVHVVTCYIVLEPGTFSALSGGVGNGFAAIKDGIVWAGETAEFDKSGIVTGAYLGTQAGNSAAVGDDIVPGNGKFTASGYTTNAFIPRLAGTPLRLNGAKLDESLFKVFNQALGTSTLPATPSQSAQGILTFQVGGDADAVQKAQSALTFDLAGDLVSVFPSRRIRVDTSRADGISVSTEGNVEVASGGLVTTFVPSVADPQGFAADVAAALPGSTSQMRWNGSWQVTAGDGTTYVGRPQWGMQSTASGSAAFSDGGAGNLRYHANGRSQLLFPDFHDYTTLQATFSTEFNDAALKVQPRMNGTAQATVLGKSYLLAPQWNLVKPAGQKPAWWMEGGMVYIKNSDGSAQGFTVR